MHDSTMTDALTMRWIPVVDGDGRTRLEARWTCPTQAVIAVPTMPVSHAA